VLHHVAQACTRAHGRCGENFVGDDQLAADAHLQFGAISLEFPRQQPAAADQAVIDADMRLEIVGAEDGAGNSQAWRRPRS
jgi:hypothetical protein